MKTHEVETREEWQAVFDGIGQQFGGIDYTDVLNETTPKLETVHKDYFNGQAGPEGAWPPLRPATVRRKGHSTILFETGRLMQSLIEGGGDAIRDVFREGANNQHVLIFGTMVEYSPFHQEGVPSRNLPKRMHVGMKEETQQQLDNDVADWTVAGLVDSN